MEGGGRVFFRETMRREKEIGRRREKEPARRDVNSQWLSTWLFTTGKCKANPPGKGKANPAGKGKATPPGKGKCKSSRQRQGKPT